MNEKKKSKIDIDDAVRFARHRTRNRSFQNVEDGDIKFLPPTIWDQTEAIRKKNGSSFT